MPLTRIRPNITENESGRVFMISCETESGGEFGFTFSAAKGNVSVNELHDALVAIDNAIAPNGQADDLKKEMGISDEEYDNLSKSNN